MEIIVIRHTVREFFHSPNSFRMYKHENAKKIELHWHEFYEVMFIVEGSGTHMLNGVAYPLTKGSLFLLTPADFHEIIPDSAREMSRYVLIFSDEMLDDELFQLLFAEAQPHISAVLAEAAFARMAADFQRLYDDAQQTRADYRLALQYTLKRILVDLCIHRLPQSAPLGQPQQTEQSGGGGVLFRKAITYIHHHFREQITLGDVARQAGWSSSYFSSRFSEWLGCSFQSYLQALRLSFAKSLLRVSNFSITDICHASGYSTLSHFERAFKRKYGSAPKNFRGAATGGRWSNAAQFQSETNEK